jgi:hypothetical protein
MTDDNIASFPPRKPSVIDIVDVGIALPPIPRRNVLCGYARRTQPVREVMA